MPEHDHIRGIEGHDELAGPPNDPPTSDVQLNPINRGVPLVGDPDASSDRYFLETESPELDDIVERWDEPDVEDEE